MGNVRGDSNAKVLKVSIERKCLQMTPFKLAYIRKSR